MIGNSVVQKMSRYLNGLRALARMNLAMSRGAATSALRRLDLTRPTTWEFSGFSQNGEDGILDVLASRLHAPNRYFIEIGASDGLENNTSWLALACKYSGLMIEGNPKTAAWGKYLITPHNYGVEYVSMFVNSETLPQLAKLAIHKDPDIFSLDIDSIDYYIAKAVLEGGFHPKIFVVEYNSAYGPEQSLTVKYRDDFHVDNSYGKSIYYGCSIAAWRKLFSDHGYHFVTVDVRGVNAFFVDKEACDTAFIDQVVGADFLENVSHTREYKMGWEKQFELMRDLEFTQV